jgi:sugar phosphate isomerase/epimerase
MLGISTAWRSEIWDNGVEIIEEILSLGAKAVELEYRISKPALKEILPFFKGGRVSVTSLHNILPRPWKIPKERANGEFVSLSAPDNDERKSAIKYTLGTMEWAERFGARAIVLHLGKVPMDGVMEFLMNIHDEGRLQTPEGKAFVQEHKDTRARLGKPLLEASLKSVDTLAKEAEKRGFLLGIENRYKIQDFPNVEEFKAIFQEFRGSSVRYWHDIGHATAQENLGLVKKGELLESFGELLAGVHLHGCRGYNDHYAPGSGEEDYLFLKKFLKPETIRVVETHHRATREELVKGLEFLREQGIA